MNRSQKIALIATLLVLALAILFPPHTSDGYTVTSLDAGDPLEMRSSEEWVFRSIFDEKTEDLDLETERLVAVGSTTYEIMQTEWFALLGFIMIVGLGVLILLKGPNSAPIPEQ